MDDGVQNGLQSDQWLSTVEKGEKRASSLGSGALRFIRTRSSIRRELKRQCHRQSISKDVLMKLGTSLSIFEIWKGTKNLCNQVINPREKSTQVYTTSHFRDLTIYQVIDHNNNST
ncbi:hypothetical protein ALC56_03214 [Trachymyrmex septentrionalis]|uniref:Uncharacterized protein n=1 Tax=Trachymyrmex septentrionalis TaxID=34720 RepID=A0A195FNT6_9HYME|nr:hypothetical protein ALC56_03214 [Trachymyrmex septentrionalis]